MATHRVHQKLADRNTTPRKPSNDTAAPISVQIHHRLRPDQLSRNLRNISRYCRAMEIIRLIMQQAREILEIRPSNEGNTGTNVGYMFRVMVNKLREEYDIVRWIFFFSFIFFFFYFLLSFNILISMEE